VLLLNHSFQPYQAAKSVSVDGGYTGLNHVCG
jgi:hypothetical protein